ncbi:hypothetical protein [Photorhabdus sp. RM71S]|uniref:hypothetical protein n=1 Tax=Photorhabdus sp. RM71S TaxID=3342824 RepID=UPI0036DCE558
MEQLGNAISEYQIVNFTTDPDLISGFLHTSIRNLPECYEPLKFEYDHISGRGNFILMDSTVEPVSD